ncbi:MAG: gutB 4 [Clostridia bacterium]|jgi:L-iditol 2-dehydrogenase|nr:gutB 4 [Clostridia bacterium]
MKAAVLHAPGDLKIEEVKVPDNLKEKEVLVRVKAAGICGSDLDRVMKSGTYKFPTIPGHEFCGEITALGAKAERFKAGDKVVVAPMIPCMQCEFCQSGNFGQCDTYNFLGSRTDGGFAEYVKVPESNLIKMPENVSFVEGAAIEPAAVTLHGMNKVRVNPGDSVAVLGCGAIGLFAVQFAKIMGAGKVIAVDIAEDKLNLAKEVGADLCINARHGDMVETITHLLGSQGVNVAIETAGVMLTQEQCLRIVKKQGRILYLGTAHKDITLPAKSFERIIRNEIMIIGSWNSYSAPFPGIEWQAALDFIKSHRLKVQPIITHTFPLYKAPEVFKDLNERKYSFTKVMFVMEE